MTPEAVQELFTRSDGSYGFARWGRPIVPVVFGIEGPTLGIVKGAIEAVVALAGHQMAETDPELGANLMMFFISDWDELPRVPKLDQLVPGLVPLCARLQAAEANQYRQFRFDADGSVKAVFVFVRMGGVLADMPAQDLALNEAVQMIVTWSDRAFSARSALARAGEVVILRPDIGEVIRASYDPLMPAVANDSSHSVRLAARVALRLAAQEQ